MKLTDDWSAAISSDFFVKNPDFFEVFTLPFALLYLLLKFSNFLWQNFLNTKQIKTQGKEGVLPHHHET